MAFDPRTSIISHYQVFPESQEDSIQLQRLGVLPEINRSLRLHRWSGVKRFVLPHASPHTILYTGHSPDHLTRPRVPGH